MAASDQLTKLAAQAKEAEDRVAAARGKAKADLEQDLRQPAPRLRPRPTSCSRRRMQAKESSRSGGTTCSARGTNTSQKFVRTSMPSGPNTTSRGRSGGPRRPRTTLRLRLITRTQPSRKRSMRCSMRSLRGWKLTNSPRNRARPPKDNARLLVPVFSSPGMRSVPR